MGEGAARKFTATGLLLLFLFSLQMAMIEPYQPLEDSEDSPSNSTPIGQPTTISIGSFPDGAVEKVSVSVPDGQVVQSLDLNVESAPLSTSTAYSFTNSQDFAGSTSFSGVNVNSTSLSLLPQEWSWDFESGSFSPEWTLGGVSNWRVAQDSRLGGSYLAQAGSITHSQSTDLTLDVSSLPAGSGTFRYSVSSEGSFDYLVFCIDNPNCSRSSGFNQRWSGSATGIHTFTLPASANTLTWKYSKDGSVNSGSDTGWIDEITITPAGGAGNGIGFWVSEPFGPEMTGQGETRGFGYMYMDAYLPPDADFEWSLLDATNNQVIHGMEGLTSTHMDLGMIDWEQYPLVKMRIDMATTSGSLPVIHGIHFEGLIADDFDTDPISQGWTLTNCNWNSGQISGSGTALSPEYYLRSGFVGLKSNSDLTGSGKIEYSLDSGQSWNLLQSNVLQTLDEPFFTVVLRVSSLGGNWALEKLEVEMIRTSVADGLEIDLGLDGIADWSLDRQGIGRLGIQDRFTDGSIWAQQSSTPSSPSQFSFYLPEDGIEKLEFSAASPDIEMINPFMTLSINGQDIVTSSLQDLSTIQTIRFSQSDVMSVNSMLSQSSPTLNINGLKFTKVDLKIGSSSTSGIVHAGGLMASYDDNLNLQFSGSDSLIIGINSVLQNTIAVSGVKEISIPIRMASTGAIKLTVNSISSLPSITPISMEVDNVTNTFTPSMKWIDVRSTFDFSGIGISNPLDYVRANSWLIDLNLIGKEQSSQIRCSTQAVPVSGLGISACIQSGVPLIWSDLGSNGVISMAQSSSVLEFTHRFKFPVDWDDEEFLTVSANLVSNNGPMLPVSKSFGLGNANGVENDVSVKHWSVVGLNGIGSDNNYPYLKQGEPVYVNVHLGFEGDELSYPRTGHVLVRLLADDSEYGTTTIVEDGVASIPWIVPNTGDSVTLEVDVLPLQSQGVSYEVARMIEFEFDAVSPQLINMNVDTYDHFESNPSKMLEFVISDRPVLPTHSKINLWRSWIDDYNGDGLIDNDEIMTEDLELPQDLSSLQGIYHYDLDTSGANDGAYVRGWLEVADSAGNLMQSSGNVTDPLFNLLVSSDGSPQLGYSNLAWEYGFIPWLHPGENISVEIPVWDKNGITDITHIEFDLSANQPDSSTFTWSRLDETCVSSTLYLQVISCSMEASFSDDLFVNNGKFKIDFKINWGFDPDESINRIPSILLRDLNGQSTKIDLSELAWRYSGEMEVDLTTIEYSITGNDQSPRGAWVQSREPIEISGDLIWSKTKREVDQELELLYTLGGNQAQVECINGKFNGSIIAPAMANTYSFEVSLRNAPNGAKIAEPDNPILWIVVDDNQPFVDEIASPSMVDLILEKDWESFELEVRINEPEYLDSDTLLLNWEIHPSGYGLSSASIASGTEQMQLLGGMPFGSQIPASSFIDIDSAISEESRTQALELRVWVTGFDMAGHEISKAYNDNDAPLGKFQLEQQLPEYSFEQPQLSPSKGIVVGDAVDLAVIIKNTGKSDGFAELRVERVESNGARTIIHAQEVKVQSGGSGYFTHRWTPDREGSMWIEFIVIGGPTAQTETFYVGDDSSDGFFGGLAEINPVLLVIIFVLMAALVALLIFGLRNPNTANQQLPPNKNYARAPNRVDPNQNAYARQQQTYSPGDNPYK